LKREIAIKRLSRPYKERLLGPKKSLTRGKK
jgi:predicted GIY-YIG superfamily endonuclease